MKENTIVTLVLNNGAEIVGRYIIEDMVNYTIYRPRLVQVSQQGVGLVNGVCMTGKEPKGNIQFSKNSVAYIVETAEEIANGWTSQTSGIALPNTGLLK
jgi:hypothetical protein